MTKAEKVELLNLLIERERRRARVDYFTFLRHLSPPEFTWNWHHEYCCKILQDWVMTDKHPFLMIFMPPQHQKSTMLTEFLPAWAFGQDINYQALLIMYNSTQAKKYNRKIQRIMDGSEYREIFPKTRLNEKRVVSSAEGSYVKNSEEFEIVGGRGFLKSVGVGGGIAGNPAKLAFLDDLIKNAQEANSNTYRERTHEWYTDELEARLHNDSKVAFTITRRHEDDQAGKLLKRDGILEEGGRWKVVKIPAIKVDDTNPDDPREIGEALFPGLHSLKRLRYIEESEPRTFAGLYQQEPKVRGGDMIKGEWFKIMQPHELPFGLNSVTWNAIIDGAWTEKVENDPTAIGFCYHDTLNDILYFRNINEFRLKISKAIEEVKKQAVSNGISGQSLFYIELKASGEAFKDYLFHAGFNAVGIKNDLVKKGKITRVQESEPKLRGGRIVLIDEGNWIKPFIQQCEQFPNGKHDDKVDVLTYGIHEFLLTGGNPYITMK